jgi:uncharacterized membrane-anchored protein
VTAGCPRCRGTAVEQHHAARRGDGSLVWQVLHCESCSFTWRTSEPAATLDPAQRPALFQLDAKRLDALPYHLPPA